jgi:hypothetical protein
MHTKIKTRDGYEIDVPQEAMCFAGTIPYINKKNAEELIERVVEIANIEKEMLFGKDEDNR